MFEPSHINETNFISLISAILFKNGHLRFIVSIVLETFVLREDTPVMSLLYRECLSNPHSTGNDVALTVYSDITLCYRGSQTRESSRPNITQNNPVLHYYGNRVSPKYTTPLLYFSILRVSQFSA